MSHKAASCKLENAAYIWCVILCYGGRTTAGIAACNHAGLEPAGMSELALKYLNNSKSIHSYLDLLLLCATDVISSSPSLYAIV